MKGRVHLFEFEDQAWLPRPWRRLITDILAHQLESWRIYERVIPLLAEALAESQSCQILDLCSGAGGPILHIARGLARRGQQIDVTVTDKFPDLRAFDGLRACSAGQIRGESIPVDATAVPRRLRGFRTLFTSFHHFRPGSARRILCDAVEAGEGIAVFEFTERNPVAVARLLLLGPTSAWLDSARRRPISLERLFWIHIIPVVPILYTWDALVSHLRSYTPEELVTFIAELGETGYRWRAGTLRTQIGGLNLTYLVGTPYNGRRPNPAGEIDSA